LGHVGVDILNYLIDMDANFEEPEPEWIQPQKRGLNLGNIQFYSM
jgi:hypothetical protein